MDGIDGIRQHAEGKAASSPTDSFKTAANSFAALLQLTGNTQQSHDVLISTLKGSIRRDDRSELVLDSNTVDNSDDGRDGIEDLNDAEELDGRKDKDFTEDDSANHEKEADNDEPADKDSEAVTAKNQDSAAENSRNQNTATEKSGNQDTLKVNSLRIGQTEAPENILSADGKDSILVGTTPKLEPDQAIVTLTADPNTGVSTEKVAEVSPSINSKTSHGDIQTTPETQTENPALKSDQSDQNDLALTSIVTVESQDDDTELTPQNGDQASPIFDSIGKRVTQTDEPKLNAEQSNQDKSAPAPVEIPTTQKNEINIATFQANATDRVAEPNTKPVTQTLDTTRQDQANRAPQPNTQQGQTREQQGAEILQGSDTGRERVIGQTTEMQPAVAQTAVIPSAATQTSVAQQASTQASQNQTPQSSEGRTDRVLPQTTEIRSPLSQAQSQDLSQRLGENTQARVQVTVDGQRANQGPSEPGQFNRFVGYNAGESRTIATANGQAGTGSASNAAVLETTENQTQRATTQTNTAVPASVSQSHSQPSQAGQIANAPISRPESGSALPQGNGGLSQGHSSQTGSTLSNTPQPTAQVAPAQSGQSFTQQVQQLSGMERPPAPTSGQYIEQIKVHINKSVKAGMDRVSIQLRPANLGRIEVKMELSQDGKVRAFITADVKDTLDMLQRDARGLERALQDAGLRTDSNNLHFALRSEIQGQGSGNQKDQTEHADNDETDGNPDDGLPAEEKEFDRQQAAAARGGVDTTV